MSTYKTYNLDEELFYKTLNVIFNDTVRHVHDCGCLGCEAYTELCMVECDVHILRQYGGVVKKED